MKRITKKPRSLVWQYFTKIDEKSAKCIFCNKVFTNFGNTSNFARHVKIQHQNEIVDKDTPSTSQSTEMAETEINPRIVDLNTELLKMIAADLQPLSIVENSSFRNFIMKLHPLYKVPSRKKITYEILPKVSRLTQLYYSNIIAIW